MAMYGCTTPLERKGGASCLSWSETQRNPPDPPPAGGCYNFTGHSQPDVQYKANAVKTSAKGYRSIWFRNGNTTIDIAYPAYYMRGERLLCVVAHSGGCYLESGLRASTCKGKNRPARSATLVLHCRPMELPSREMLTLTISWPRSVV